MTAAGPVAAFPAVPRELWTALLESVATRGLTDAATFYRLSNALSAEAEHGDVAAAAAALRRLARDAARCHGTDSLVAVRLAANAAAFTGLAGDPAAALAAHEEIWRGWRVRGTPAFDAHDRARIESNLEHWRRVCRAAVP
ncbi:MAG: hypothetical protein ACT4RN_09965 [Pseudonocardia sp.]